MNRKVFFGRSLKDILVAVGPVGLAVIIVIGLAYKFVDPAPPKHLVISTSEDEGDYQTYAKLYQDIMKDDGVELEIRRSTGAMENLQRLEDTKSDVEVAFVPDGLGSAEKDPNISSLGSIYYEPIWVFYRGKAEITRFHQFIGKRIAIGQKGGGTHVLAFRLLQSAGVDRQDATFVDIGSREAANALKSGQVDAAVFVLTSEDPMVLELLSDRNLRLMSVDQAEAISRRNPFLHHLILPHGALDLRRNLPDRDTDLVAPTATLLVRDTIHPALSYLLLKAASEVHSDPGIFEKRHEFPVEKDDEFPLNPEAKRYYKSGTPFWQRYLPFWLATLVERFILVVLPAAALIIPLVKTIPQILTWRVKSRIYQRYGELKFLETQIRKLPSVAKGEQIKHLDQIEDRVNHMKVPLDFADHIYVLREHVDFVRRKLEKDARA